MIAIVFALKYESTACRFLNASDVQIWNLGITGARSVDVLRKFIQKEKPAILISAGLAAGLQNHLSIGSLILGENYTSPHILRILRPSHGMIVGRIYTASHIISTAAEKQRLGQQTGALVGDMETAHIYEFCQQSNIPMVSLRSISDTVDQGMPVASSLLINPQTCRPNPIGLFLDTLRYPTQISGLFRLMRQSRKAVSTLAVGLKAILPQLSNSP